MHVTDLFRQAMADPERIPPFVRSKGTRYALSFNSAVQELTRESPCTVVEEDWDNLLILDGCRYDTFRSQNYLDGRLESRISRGTESWEFLRENFAGRQLHDTIYITANPHAPKLPSGSFHSMINVLESLWNPHLETVLPEVLASETRQIAAENPNKRLVVHFMQPHFPFIGRTGREIAHKGINSHTEDGDDGKHVWSALERGTLEADLRSVREAYVENLQVVLAAVSDLIDAITGRTVITSDHGNLLGERSWPLPVRGYGHPAGIRVTGLVKVPWLVVESDERKTVASEQPVDNQRLADDVVSQRLEDLGYAD